ncbi:MAG: hypothetical protein JSW33_02305 [bacterium]|nr:MAG: hypothetical protein JSW33_02305 [bacterium]
MQKTIKSAVLVILFLVIFLKSGLCHDLGDTSQVKELIPQLISAYENFNYEKSASLLEVALQNLHSFSNTEVEQIYLYGALLAFNEGNTERTSHYFWEILRIDPSYTVDPVNTPPKMLSIFQKTKIEYLEDLNRRLQVTEMTNHNPPFPWRAMLFPGWEQWHRGYKTKGISLAFGGLATITGAVISIIQTEQRRDAYQQETDPNLIPPLYDTYHDAYQRQFYFGYAFVAIWAFSQFDLAVWSQDQLNLKASITPDSRNMFYPAVHLNLRF